MKILVTGFDPFGQDIMNPAIEAVKRLPEEISGAQIIKLEIPTVFNKSAEVMAQAMKEHDVDYVLNIGQAGGRFDLTPERVAINLDDARIPDNEGNQPIDVVIKEDGEVAYFSQLPVKAMVTAMKQVGLPASVSNTAGTFVCNHIMYQGLYLTHTAFPKAKAGFMHVPFLPEQVVERPGMPAMSLEDITRGIVAAIEAIVAFDGKADLAIVGGQTH
ncbi:pyroglutamyl-peptidase I [Vagococcus sp. DIV0080]|uniref:Pyrrolidone-carboxylate peptidase n=1 Tax=Candidatus Vagococcus giribetii TaxID=2230876 RepID=A0ABS3HV96_9ENTE|nr:pyroglutamyl-peptidase I [Vagococcus sp. DIV0080]MBO0476766.1 pyroglutamyl-peptidase I [Vagococcus sp. DIV0080]